MRLLWILAALVCGLALLTAALWNTGERSAAIAAREFGVSAAAPHEVSTELREPTFVADPVEGAAEPEDGSARSPVRRAVPSPVRLRVQMLVERLIVRGRVRAPVADLERTTVELRRDVGRTTTTLPAGCAADGSYEIDASELLDQQLRTQSSSSFELLVAHPECIPVVAPFKISSGRSPDAETEPRFQWTAGTTVCELDVALVLGAHVYGRLVGVAEPQRAVVVAAGAHGGLPVQPWLAQVEPDERGAFELLLPRGASYAVVAAAHGMRPELEWIDVHHAGAHELVIRPDRGAELSGSVRIAPLFPPQGFGVELQFALEPGAPEPEPWPRPAPGFDALVWLDGAFEWRLHNMRTDPRGQFVFGGLAPREYELRAFGVGMPGEQLRAWPVARLSAPTAGAALGPILASLDLDLGPLGNGPLAFELADESGRNALRLGPYNTDARGLAQLHLPPGRDYHVMVGPESFGRFSTPAAGESARFALRR